MTEMPESHAGRNLVKGLAVGAALGAYVGHMDRKTGLVRGPWETFLAGFLSFVVLIAGALVYGTIAGQASERTMAPHNECSQVVVDESYCDTLWPDY